MLEPMTICDKDNASVSPSSGDVPLGLGIGRFSWSSVSSMIPAGITLVALLLRLLMLAEKSVWGDEIWSIRVAGMPWHSALWSALHQDANMSLYHALLHVWMFTGQSEFAIRSFSALAGAATIPVLYLVGKRLFDRWVGIVASALLALNLFHIQYSQEARSYSLVAFLATVSTWFFIRCLECPRAKNWVLYGMAVVLGVYSHVFVLLVFVSHLLSLVFLRPREVQWKRLIASAVGIGGLSMPLAVLLYMRARAPFVALNWIPRPTVRRVYDLFYALAGNANFYGVEVGKAPGEKCCLSYLLRHAL